MRNPTSPDREQTLERLMNVYGDQVMRTCLLFLQNMQLAEDASH